MSEKLTATLSQGMDTNHKIQKGSMTVMKSEQGIGLDIKRDISNPNGNRNPHHKNNLRVQYIKRLISANIGNQFTQRHFHKRLALFHTTFRHIKNMCTLRRMKAERRRGEGGNQPLRQ